MPLTRIRFGTVVAALLVISGVGTVSAQDDLRKQIVALQDGQTALRKELDTIRDLLAGEQPPLDNVLIEARGSRFFGDRSAHVAIIEFSDFQCPFCGNFFNTTYPLIYNDYVKTGKVAYFFRDFPLSSLHPAAAKAAEAARCADEQGKFREMHDRLFMNQQTLDVTYLPVHAAALGLDQMQFKACLTSGRYAVQVRADVEEGQRLGVKGTPSFFLGRYDARAATVAAMVRIDGAQPYSTFRDALDKLLKAD